LRFSKLRAPECALSNTGSNPVRVAVRSKHFIEPVEVAGVRRALVTILDEEPTSLTHETAIVSERSLAEDWNRPEEDAAWSHLQRDR
jgi:hypothetical protein